MLNIAVITARSGSKGLTDKNIRPLNGIPLMAYSIQAAIESNLFDEVMVSTDSDKYAQISLKYGASVPFLRSAKLSGDMVGSWDVIKEVLEKYKTMGRYFDTVCLLQPTSPLRTADDIKNSYDEFVKKEADAITSVCEVDHSPLWTMTLEEDKSLSEFRKRALNVPRQKLKTYYRLNGAIYIRRIDYSNNNVNILSEREFAYIMERRKSIDIDTREDFEYASFLLQQGK